MTLRPAFLKSCLLLSLLLALMIGPRLLSGPAAQAEENAHSPDAPAGAVSADGTRASQTDKDSASASSAPAAKAERPEVMSRLELRQCMDRREALERRRKILDAEQALSDSEAGALANEARLLSEQMRDLDARDQVRLNALNRQFASHNASVRRYNSSLDALSNETSQLNADIADMMASCTTKLYSREDQEAIQAERRGAPAAH